MIKNLIRKYLGLPEEGNNGIGIGSTAPMYAPDRLDGRRFSFSIIPANGGVIIETYNNSSIKSKLAQTGGYEEPTLKYYLVTTEQDLATELGKIVTLEMVRNA